jgi:hypothetical protein
MTKDWVVTWLSLFCAEDVMTRNRASTTRYRTGWSVL